MLGKTSSKPKGEEEKTPEAGDQGGKKNEDGDRKRQEDEERDRLEEEEATRKWNESVKVVDGKIRKLDEEAHIKDFAKFIDDLHLRRENVEDDDNSFYRAVLEATRTSGLPIADVLKKYYGPGGPAEFRRDLYNSAMAETNKLSILAKYRPERYAVRFVKRHESVLKKNPDRDIAELAYGDLLSSLRPGSRDFFGPSVYPVIEALFGICLEVIQVFEAGDASSWKCESQTPNVIRVVSGPKNRTHYDALVPDI
jgi:hypothetical protein